MTLADGAGDFALAVDGLSLRCSAEGEGLPVLLLHAGGERRSVWRPVARALAAAGFRAVAIDQRGYGETGGSLPVQLEPFGRDVRAVLDALPGRVALVGASLGGFAAMAALAHSGAAARASALVLVDVLPDRMLGERGRVFLRASESKLGRRFPWQLIEDCLARGEDELARVVAALRAPVAVIRGSAGVIAPSALARFLRQVPQATSHVVPGAGHLVARERPHELAVVLIDVLRTAHWGVGGTAD